MTNIDSILKSWHTGLVTLQHVGTQFPYQGSNLCPLHWQAEHQGSPSVLKFLVTFKHGALLFDFVYASQVNFAQGHIPSWWDL